MHQVLREILDTQTVWDGNESIPLYDNMSEEGGGLITKAIEMVKPQVTLEVGSAVAFRPFSFAMLWWRRASNANTSSSTQIKNLYSVISGCKIYSARAMSTLSNYTRSHLNWLYRDFLPREHEFKSLLSTGGIPSIIRWSISFI